MIEVNDVGDTVVGRALCKRCEEKHAESSTQLFRWSQLFSLARDLSLSLSFSLAALCVPCVTVQIVCVLCATGCVYCTLRGLQGYQSNKLSH